MNNINNFEDAKKLFQQGLKKFQEENYKDAELNFLECLKLVPDRLSTVHNLISIYIATEQKNRLREILKFYNLI